MNYYEILEISKNSDTKVLKNIIIIYLKNIILIKIMVYQMKSLNYYLKLIQPFQILKKDIFMI